MTVNPVTRFEKRRCLEREIAMRRRAYPRWVREGRMTQAEADREIDVMTAILRDYDDPGLFDAKDAAA
jgi:hypothetical protein